MNTGLILDFLTSLRQHNDRQWFDAHRGEYENAREGFLELLDELLIRFPDKRALPQAEAKSLMFRINRDVRFSKDKSPYKVNMSALIGPHGRKSQSRYYYISIEPGGRSIAASGLKSPDAKTLRAVRQRIADNSEDLRSIIEAESIVSMFGGLEGEKLKTAPRDFAQDHPAIDLLRYKEYMASRSFSDEEVLQDTFIDELLESFRRLQPLVEYFDGIVG